MPVEVTGQIYFHLWEPEIDQVWKKLPILSHYNRLGACIWSAHSSQLRGGELLAEGTINSTIHIGSAIAQTPCADFTFFHSAEHLLLRNLALWRYCQRHIQWQQKINVVTYPKLLIALEALYLKWFGFITHFLHVFFLSLCVIFITQFVVFIVFIWHTISREKLP